MVPTALWSLQSGKDEWEWGSLGMSDVEERADFEGCQIVSGASCLLVLEEEGRECEVGGFGL